MQQFVKDIQKLVAANRPKLVLAVLTDFFEKYSADFHQQTLMVQANLSQTEREQATGVLSAVEARQSFAKINASLLYLIDAIPSCSSDAATAIARAQEIDRAFREVEPALIAPVNNRSSWIWLAILALLALVGAGWWLMSHNQSAPARTTLTEPPPVPKTLAEKEAESKAWRQKAADYSKQGQWQEALQASNQAFGLGFDNATLFNERADIYLHLGRFAEARNDAQKSITLDANFCWAYMSLAQASSKLGDEEGFYSNTELALRKHCEVGKFTEQTGLFEYRDKPRFKRLLQQYR